MRIMSLLTALAVSVMLYLAMFERDRLMMLTATSPGVQVPDAQTAAPPVVVDAERRVSVVVQRSTAVQVDGSVLARGRTEAARQVEVRAEISGLVVSDPLRRGAYVTAGQTLCQLAPGTRTAALAEAVARETEAAVRLPEAEARLAEARARLAEAQIIYDSATRLSEGGFASQTRVVGAEATLETARAGITSAQSGVQAAMSGIETAGAGVGAAQIEIERLTLTAPFQGLLETDTAELGSLLQPGAPCATVIQLDPIKLVGFISEADVDKVTVGALAGARLISGAETVGRVTFLSRSADPATRTFRVEVTVPNADLAIRDGQTAEMLISAEGRAAHLLPSSALTLDDDGTLGLRLVQDGRAAFAPVTLLRDTSAGVWLAGLPDTADVIVVGQEFVIDGVAVDVTLRGAGQ